MGHFAIIHLTSVKDHVRHFMHDLENLSTLKKSFLVNEKLWIYWLLKFRNTWLNDKLCSVNQYHFNIDMIDIYWLNKIARR